MINEPKGSEVNTPSPLIRNRSKINALPAKLVEMSLQYSSFANLIQSSETCKQFMKCSDKILNKRLELIQLHIDMFDGVSYMQMYEWDTTETMVSRSLVSYCNNSIMQDKKRKAKWNYFREKQIKNLNFDSFSLLRMSVKYIIVDGLSSITAFDPNVKRIEWTKSIIETFNHALKIDLFIEVININFINSYAVVIGQILSCGRPRSIANVELNVRYQYDVVMRMEKVTMKTKNQLAEQIFDETDKLNSFLMVRHDNNCQSFKLDSQLMRVSQRFDTSVGHSKDTCKQEIYSLKQRHPIVMIVN